MFGLQELKKKVEVEGDTIVCPVIGCEARVKKMVKGVPRSLDAYLEKRRNDRERFAQYLCKEHKIYITRTTFIYGDLRDNLLWYDMDKDLLDKIMGVKRVRAQLHHDNSEDAVTWNVFRFLERTKLLSGFLEELRNSPVKNPEVIYWSYWSYPQSQQKVWNELERARKEFEERSQRSSEPDLIVKSDDALFFIEVKLTALNKIDFNKNHTAEDKAERVRRYSKGDYFLKQSVEHIIDAGYYQLMRFWLIGSWIANNENLDFYLLNLVRKDEEKDIELEFGECIEQNENRKFMRVTWEDIYKYISATDMLGEDKDKILRYFRNKTIGYPINGELQKAFSI